MFSETSFKLEEMGVLDSQIQSIESQEALMGQLHSLHSKRNGEQSSGAGLSEKVYDYVVENISNGNWPFGSKIVERQVAKELGISHIPVREAMEKLKQNGWVNRIANRGAFVRDCTSSARMRQICL